jgi:TPR repeat protein
VTIPARAIVPIVGAAVLGAWVAFATSRTQPAEEPPPEASVLRSERSASTLQAVPEAPPTSSAKVPGAAPSPTAQRGAPSVAPAESVVAASSASPPSADKPTVVLEVITSADQQLQAEIECDRKKLPESCERVARALESGSAGTRDATRAGKLRRVALTLYVKQCESDRALACTRLAEMHEQGELVQKNPRNAAALRTRVVDLCRLRPNQLGCQPNHQ